MRNNTAKWFGNKFVYSFITCHQKSISKQRYWWQFSVVGDILSYNERILQNGELNVCLTGLIAKRELGKSESHVNTVLYQKWSFTVII